MPRAARATALAQRLLDAQVRHHVAELTGERGAATASAVTEELLDGLGAHQLEDVVDRAVLVDGIVRALATIPGSGATRGVVELLVDTAHEGPAEQVTLAEVVDGDQVVALVDALLALHPHLEQGLDRLAASPLVGTVAARFMGRIVNEAMQANQELAGRVPGLGSLVSFGTRSTTRMVGVADRQLSGLLGDSLGRGGTYAVRRLNRVIVETVRDPVTRDAVLQVWDLVSREPLGGSAIGGAVSDAASGTSGKRVRGEARERARMDTRAAAGAVADAAHDLVVTTAAGPHVAELVAVLVDGFFDRFGGYTPTELLAELDVDRADLVAEVTGLVTRALDVLHESGQLERIVRARLEPFYASPEVVELLSAASSPA